MVDVDEPIRFNKFTAFFLAHCQQLFCLYCRSRYIRQNLTPLFKGCSRKSIYLNIAICLVVERLVRQTAAIPSAVSSAKHLTARKVRLKAGFRILLISQLCRLHNGKHR